MNEDKLLQRTEDLIKRVQSGRSGLSIDDLMALVYQGRAVTTDPAVEGPRLQQLFQQWDELTRQADKIIGSVGGGVTADPKGGRKYDSYGLEEHFGYIDPWTKATIDRGSASGLSLEAIEDLAMGKLETYVSKLEALQSWASANGTKLSFTSDATSGKFDYKVEKDKSVTPAELNARRVDYFVHRAEVIDAAKKVVGNNLTMDQAKDVDQWVPYHSLLKAEQYGIASVQEQLDNQTLTEPEAQARIREIAKLKNDSIDDISVAAQQFRGDIPFSERVRGVSAPVPPTVAPPVNQNNDASGADASNAAPINTPAPTLTPGVASRQAAVAEMKNTADQVQDPSTKQWHDKNSPQGQAIMAPYNAANASVTQAGGGTSGGGTTPTPTNTPQANNPQDLAQQFQKVMDAMQKGDQQSSIMNAASFMQDFGTMISGLTQMGDLQIEDYAPSKYLQEMVNTSRRLMETGVPEEVSEQQRGDARRALDVDLGVVKTAAGGSGGAVLGNRFQAFREHSDALAKISNEDVMAKLAAAPIHMDALAQMEAAHKERYVRRYEMELARQNAAAELVSGSIKNMHNAAQMQQQFGKGSVNRVLAWVQAQDVMNRKKGLDMSGQNIVKELETMPSGVGQKEGAPGSGVGGGASIMDPVNQQ